MRLIGIADPGRVDERTPTFAVRVGDQHPLETSAALAERGIFTWDGHYYAIEVFDRLGLLDTGGAVRIGFCHYHTLGRGRPGARVRSEELRRDRRRAGPAVP